LRRSLRRYFFAEPAQYLRYSLVSGQSRAEQSGWGVYAR